MRLLIFLSGLAVSIAAPGSVPRAVHAPLLIPRGDDASLVADRYVVYLRSGASEADHKDAIKSFNIKPRHEYKHLRRGFSANLDGNTLAGLRRHPAVDFIEQVTTSSISSSEPVKRALENSTGTPIEQKGATWNLGRISNQNSTSEGESKYVYDSRAGEGTCTYVIDTGVDDTHPEFEGRALQIKSFVANSTVDDSADGHGTHVAGIIGSASYGVAKKTKIFGIKVLDSNGDAEGDRLIAGYASIGLEYVPVDAANRTCPNGVVVNYSINSNGYAKSLNVAAAELAKKGYFVAVAAGNKPRDVAQSSPASEATVCTVGSIDINNKPAVDTGYGPGVDVMAPGVDIMSLQPDNRTSLLSGTSMATPHVTGLAAYFASIHGKSAIPNMCQYLKDVAIKGAVKEQRLYTANLVANNAAVDV
ncbi:serine protease [Metarhizium guizhouense ARSEF 977]|uniref:Serine protease n=1 Tax=Metarhizium guizhouense (strain ARSEF 977) TaxID=1276136 RepID=A0A0B4GU45_METGA|nr:serine protease [Metarhizium guizhouense ARSEF 977]